MIKPITISLLLAVSVGSAAFASPSGIQGQNQSPTRPAGIGGPTGFRDRCPEGQQPSSWQKPIYDDDGIFVVGYETVATCVPEGLRPAG
ncbi:hypothetical protein L3556_02090 [Candidatus Synechococcus calcipolaris G9]|uniref:Uncharacterized protein n=1 Tax=Candidatus Synechococcus calcipolaris G9 TaxID=1497997 RepID=A0ABT6EVB4_9SYNE|nr:hypothetical protein [Candidatus Synechococcus calcipolaris]MDG2989730.1 hypothetical protein [Candidatus Synechococcus calcipolaris G9]